MAIFRTSQAGIDKIKRHESLRLKPYQDATGHWTIGYGHLIGSDEIELMDPAGITEEKAESLLRQDLREAEIAINRLVTVPISGPQFDALVSFVFNIGVGAFKNSTLLEKLNAGDYKGAANEFQRWKYSNGIILDGLITRREQEAELFRSG